jgi:signal transduction histidine kinase
MKDTAASVLEGCQYALSFPDKPDGRKVSLDWRQHVYLIFKEALTNIARHASASRVMIVVSIDADVLTLTIEDNGKGFVPDSARVGNGLRNMRERADALKAEFSTHSAPARGTTISLKVRIT